MGERGWSAERLRLSRLQAFGRTFKQAHTPQITGRERTEGVWAEGGKDSPKPSDPVPKHIPPVSEQVQ